MSDIRELVSMLKRKFVSWRTPPVELPAESVIEEVVKEVWEAGRGEAMEIVRDLAEKDPVYWDEAAGIYLCALCSAIGEEDDVGYPKLTHVEDCPWFRARRLVEAEKGAAT